jgi:hypothetical protein
LLLRFVSTARVEKCFLSTFGVHIHITSNTTIALLSKAPTARDQKEEQEEEGEQEE